MSNLPKYSSEWSALVASAHRRSAGEYRKQAALLERVARDLTFARHWAEVANEPHLSVQLSDEKTISVVMEGYEEMAVICDNLAESAAELARLL